MILIKDLKLKIDHKDAELYKKICKTIDYNNTCSGKEISYKIARKSIDARKRPDIYFIYSVYVFVDSVSEAKIKKIVNKKHIKNITFEEPFVYSIPECGNESLKRRPVIIGSGPAGLFTALNMAKRGFKPIVIERGECVEDRTKTVEKSFNTGVINTESNVQFGEGGAGTFSDGKLNTLTKDTNGRNSYVLNTFHQYGAPEEITYYAKPHIGTDLLIDIVRNMRKAIIDMGGTFYFNTKLIDLVIKDNKISGVILKNTVDGHEFELASDIVALCIGHSARDTFEMLYKNKLNMEPKSFAVGFRVSHPQSYVDMWQYGIDDASKLGLGAADYKVTNEASNGRRVYSFCMCPGGYVVNASSEANQLCVNGMSYSKRDSKVANSAIICGITPDDFIQEVVSDDHPLKGMYYQRAIEKEAYKRGGENGDICCQNYDDFKNNVSSNSLNNDIIRLKGNPIPGNLRGIFATEIDAAIIESIDRIGQSRNGFDGCDTIMYGIEARTSSPVRIIRDEKLVSNIKGIYPCGEGCGYAGGITSAAADGVRIAEEIIKKYKPTYGEEI